jgi:hypothetical protein
MYLRDILNLKLPNLVILGKQGWVKASQNTTKFKPKIKF